jgi:hypothetical protein
VSGSRTNFVARGAIAGKILIDASERSLHGAEERTWAVDNMRMELGDVMMRLYNSEINFSVSTFWDNGFDVKLGDEMNGFVAEANVKTPAEAAEFLDRSAREHFAESVYALGREEHERRELAGRKLHLVE